MIALERESVWFSIVYQRRHQESQLQKKKEEKQNKKKLKCEPCCENFSEGVAWWLSVDGLWIGWSGVAVTDVWMGIGVAECAHDA